jgi:hypothetical protein
LQALECYEVQRELQKPQLPYSPHDLAMRHWLMLRSLAVRNKLLALTTLDARLDVVRIALLMWTLLPPNDVRQGKTAEVVARKLRDILEYSPSSAWVGSEDLRFWCLLVGYSSAQRPSGTLAWFGREIRDMVRTNSTDLGIRPLSRASQLLEELVAFQERFLLREEAPWPMTEQVAEYIFRGDP